MVYHAHVQTCCNSATVRRTDRCSYVHHQITLFAVPCCSRYVTSSFPVIRFASKHALQNTLTVGCRFAAGAGQVVFVTTWIPHVDIAGSTVSFTTHLVTPWNGCGISALSPLCVSTIIPGDIAKHISRPGKGFEIVKLGITLVTQVMIDGGFVLFLVLSAYAACAIIAPVY